MFLTQKKEEEKSTSFSFSLPFSDFPSEIKISSFCLSLLSLSSILSIHSCPSPTTANSLHFKANPFLFSAVALNLKGAELFSILFCKFTSVLQILSSRTLHLRNVAGAS
ncbi:hypothetical protein GLYMA_09G258850v4 [Glycine max]|nr:hypothetical protein GLYMA_09G258850v4 [Glycine max]